MDDAADAWGWGDDDVAEPDTETRPSNVPVTENLPPIAQPLALAPEVREMIISEKYWTTSLPQPVFNTVTTIYEEGAKLTRPEFVLALQTIKQR